MKEPKRMIEDQKAAERIKPDLVTDDISTN